MSSPGGWSFIWKTIYCTKTRIIAIGIVYLWIQCGKHPPDHRKYLDCIFEWHSGEISNVTNVNVVIVAHNMAQVFEQLIIAMQVIVNPHYPAGIELVHSYLIITDSFEVTPLFVQGTVGGICSKFTLKRLTFFLRSLHDTKSAISEKQESS